MTDEEIRDKLKKYFGKPPYDGPGNISKGCGYFAHILLLRTREKSIDELCRRVGFQR